MHCSYAHNTYIPIVVLTLGLSGLIIVLSHFYPWLNCTQVFCMIHTNQSDPMRMNAWESVAFYFFYLQTTIACEHFMHVRCVYEILEFPKGYGKKV